MTTRSRFRRLHLVGIVTLVALGLGSMPAVVHATTITVTTTADENGAGSACSLREAIRAANQDTLFGGCAEGDGDDTIAVPAGTYTLTVAGALDITSSLTLTGAGRGTTVIAGNHMDHVFNVRGAGVTANIEQVAVRGMDETGPGEVYQAIHIGPEAALDLTGSSVSASDSAIVNEGTLELTGSDARGGSRYSEGGGIRNSGRATVVTSTVEGGGGPAGGAIANDGVMVVERSSVRGPESSRADAAR